MGDVDTVGNMEQPIDIELEKSDVNFDHVMDESKISSQSSDVAEGRLGRRLTQFVTYTHNHTTIGTRPVLICKPRMYNCAMCTCDLDVQEGNLS